MCSAFIFSALDSLFSFIVDRFTLMLKEKNVSGLILSGSLTYRRQDAFFLPSAKIFQPR
jgi:hypothetical protein